MAFGLDKYIGFLRIGGYVLKTAIDVSSNDTDMVFRYARAVAVSGSVEGAEVIAGADAVAVAVVIGVRMRFLLAQR